MPDRRMSVPKVSSTQFMISFSQRTILSDLHFVNSSKIDEKYA